MLGYHRQRASSQYGVGVGSQVKETGSLLGAAVRTRRQEVYGVLKVAGPGRVNSIISSSPQASEETLVLCVHSS